VRLTQNTLRAIGTLAIVAVVLAGLHFSGLALPVLLSVGLVVLIVCWMLPWIGVRWLDDAILAVRSWYWASDEGRFHSFGGVPLQIDDDGRYLWVDGEGYMRVLGRREPEASLAARFAGHWRRHEDGEVLMLRVDAVVRHLATMPGRADPRVQRLRRYFEREVLYPASQRRARERDSAG
jgi:hypothetical protein